MSVTAEQQDEIPTVLCFGPVLTERGDASPYQFVERVIGLCGRGFYGDVVGGGALSRHFPGRALAGAEAGATVLDHYVPVVLLAAAQGDEALGFVSALLARGTAGLPASTVLIPDIDAPSWGAVGTSGGVSGTMGRRGGATPGGRGPRAQESPVGPVDPRAHVRVMTLNLLSPDHGGWERRRPVLRAGIRALQPDLVALQERVWGHGYDQASDLLGADYVIAGTRLAPPTASARSWVAAGRSPMSGRWTCTSHLAWTCRGVRHPGDVTTAHIAVCRGTPPRAGERRADDSRAGRSVVDSNCRWPRLP